MDTISEDGTEQTPQPKQYRPPPMVPQSQSSSKQGKNAPPAHRWPESVDRNDTSLLSVNTFRTKGTGVDSFSPSVPVQPPSPMSFPDGSLFGEDFLASSKAFRLTPNKFSLSQKPPIQELQFPDQFIGDSLLDDPDADTFLECLQDRSMAQRTKRSINLQTPPPTSSSSLNHRNNQASMDLLSYTPSIASSTGLSLDPFGPLGDSSSLPPPLAPSNHAASPSPLQVSKVHESALQAIKKLKEELGKANERNESLQKQHKEEDEEQQQNMAELQAQLDSLQASMTSTQASNASLQEQLSVLRKERDRLLEDKSHRDSQVSTLTRERKEAMHRALASDNRVRELKQKLDQTISEMEDLTQQQTELNQENAKLQREKEKLAKELASWQSKFQAASEKSQQDASKFQQLSEESVAKDQEMASLKATLNDTLQKSRQEIQRYQTEVTAWQQKYQDDIHRYKALVDRLRASLRTNRAATPLTSNGRGSSTSEEPMDASIADRLARLRDSTERAQLIKAHKRDMSRLKLEYEQQVHRLTTSHQAAIERATEETRAEMSTQMETMKRTLTQEYNQKLKDTENRHHEQFVKMQNEYMHNQEASDDSLETALAKIATITQKLERESSRRNALEESISRQRKDMEEERKRLQSRHAAELSKKRQEWEAERDTLLTVIQKDCNVLIEQKRQARSTPRAPAAAASLAAAASPVPDQQSTHSEFFSKLTIETTDLEDGVPSMVSPSSSDMDNVLRETENLIHSLDVDQN
eukprot:Nitzschia sp. Nitz4//scaffold358_size24170//19364//21693//NITZ4_008433-RA/size24170-processed-gene-0.36-mRNA-1//-1//CDS//3329549008//7281//frame0